MKKFALWSRKAPHLIIPVLIRSLLRTSLSYLIIISIIFATLLPIVVGIGNAEFNSQLAEEKNKFSLSLQSVNDRISSLCNTFLHIHSIEGFDRLALIRNQSKPRDYISMSKARNALAGVAGADDLVIDIVVTYKNSEVIISSRHVFDTHKDYAAFHNNSPEIAKVILQTIYPSTEQKEYPLFLSPVLYHPLDRPSATQVFPFQFPLPNSAHRSFSHGMITVFLDKEKTIQTLLSGHNANAVAYTLWADENAVISNNNSNIALDNSLFAQMLQTDHYAHLHIDGSILSLDVSLPINLITHAPGLLMKLFIRLLCIASVIAIIVSFYLSIKSLRPIIAISEDLSKAGYAGLKNENAFQFIDRSINDIIMRAQNMKGLLADFRSQQEDHQIVRLLLGDNQITETCTIEFPRQFCLAYGEYCITSDLDSGVNDSMSILLHKWLSQKLPRGWRLNWFGRSAVVIIMTCSSKTQDQTVNALNNILQQCIDEMSIQISCAVSNVCESLESVGSVFEETRSAYYLQMSSTANHDHAFHADSVSTGNRSFNIKDLTSLYHTLISGKGHESETIIKNMMSVYDDMLMDIEQVHYMIRGTIGLAAKTVNVTTMNLPQKYSRALPPSTNLDRLLHYIYDFCYQIENNRKSQNHELVKKIMQYIDDNYRDPELYGVRIAAYAGISEKYLYSFIKSHTGQTISEIIQNKRLEYAIMLLTQTNKPINDIWSVSGFNSHNTFYKLIKRQHGVSPSEIRAHAQLKP